MPDNHHCMACKKTGFCRNHQIKCGKHSKVVFYRKDSTGYPQKCKECVSEQPKPAPTINPRPVPSASEVGEESVGVVSGDGLGGGLGDEVKEDDAGSNSEDDDRGGEDGDEDEDDDADEEEDVESLREEAKKIAIKALAEIHASSQLLSLEYVARGGYNYVWLVKYSMDPSQERSLAGPDKSLILRISRGDLSLQPYRTPHEVACLRFLKQNVPSIPVPEVYAWDDGASNTGPAFIAQEFIEGQRLSVAWPNLTENQKATISREIANVIADLGETRFQNIGGLALDAPAGPTIEAAKLFNGRAKFHSTSCYNIGPYSDTTEYIRSCYDREIYFYTHADDADIIAEAFEETSVADFVTQLKAERDELLTNTTLLAEMNAEPLVLVHEDYHAGNMLVRNGHLVAVLDWEFSGVYPLSELLGAIAILQISEPQRGDGDWAEEEEMKWEGRYREEVEHVLRERGWRERDITIALSGGHHILQKARSIMFP